MNGNEHLKALAAQLRDELENLDQSIAQFETGKFSVRENGIDITDRYIADLRRTREQLKEAIESLEDNGDVALPED